MIVTGYTAFDEIISNILDIWPEHERYLKKNVSQRDPSLLKFSDQLSASIIAISKGTPGGLKGLVRDYRYLCEDIVLPEELHFRRHGTYRLTNFEDANRTVYADREFMTRYMNGLLVSDVIWINHCECMRHYSETFLPSLPEGSSLLEIGPGHGLLLALTAPHANVSSVTAWDISDASLALAAHTQEVLDARQDIAFVKRNIFEPSIMAPENANLFDGVVLSEVLEHLEEPLQSIRVLHHIVKPGGRVWINVPANSPAPDHLYLIQDIEAPKALLEEAGFIVDDARMFPTSGTTLEKALDQQLTINCVLIGRKPQAS